MGPCFLRSPATPDKTNDPGHLRYQLIRHAVSAEIVRRLRCTESASHRRVGHAGGLGGARRVRTGAAAAEAGDVLRDERWAGQRWQSRRPRRRGSPRGQMLAAVTVGAGDRTWRAYLSTQATGGQPAVNAKVTASGRRALAQRQRAAHRPERGRLARIQQQREQADGAVGDGRGYRRCA